MMSEVLLTESEFNSIMSYMKDSITLLDTRTRTANPPNSVLLWNHEAQELRDNLYFALEILGEQVGVNDE